MSKTTSLEARAAALGARPAQPAKPPAPRSHPVKMTVELAPDLYRAVKAFPEDMALPDATGRARIPSVEVFRALVEELIDSPELRKSVAKRIRENVTD